MDMLHAGTFDSVPSLTSSHRESADDISAAVSKLSMSSSKVSSEEDSRIYYRRQKLANSLEGRRVDLITITDCYGATGQVETHPSGIMRPHEAEGSVVGGAGGSSPEPAALFAGKKVTPTPACTSVGAVL